MPRVKELSDRPGFFLRLLIRIAVVLYVIFCVVSIISAQNSIAEKERELAEIQENIYVVKAENEDLEDILKSDDISRYMEKLAIENSSYSYAYPDERRYYDTSRD